MLYTNVELEVIQDDKGRRHLELANVYGKSIYLPIKEDKLEKMSLVKFNYNNNLTLETTEKGNICLTESEDKDNLYIILDLLDYKKFSKNSLLLTLSGLKEKDRFETMRFYRFSNRSNKRAWGVHVLKAPKNKFSILKMVTTSGAEKYLVICDGIVTIANERDAKKILRSKRIAFNLDNAKWELLKR